MGQYYSLRPQPARLRSNQGNQEPRNFLRSCITKRLIGAAFKIAGGLGFDQAEAMKLFLFVLLTLPLSVFADGGLPTQPYIYVQGTAEIQKPADMVTLRFEVVARAADES